MKPDPYPPTRTNRPIQPTLVLYLKDTSGIDYSSDAAVAASFARDPAFQKLAETYGGIAKLAPRRAFKSNAEALRRLIQRAAKDASTNGVRGYRPLEFDHYFLISVPRGSSSGKPPFDLYCDLKAATQPRGGKVFYTPPTRPAAASNDYLGSPEQGGICAGGLTSSVSGRPITGSGQMIVDVEKAWLTVNPTPSIPPSVPVAESGELADLDHGAAVASIILGGGNVGAVGGIAPGADFYKAPCIELAGTMDPSLILASTILDAALQLASGARGTGVLLIEQETWDQLPIEAQPLEFEAIRTAAAAGHVVIQPAGNLGDNLNGYSGWVIDASGNWVPRPLDPSAGGPTSGAMVIAAGRSGRIPGDRRGDRSPKSNFGNIIDAWAWGDSIAALGVTVNASGNPIPFATPDGFGGTSGGAAIVAGAVLLMQQFRAEAGKPQLTPPEVRKILLEFGIRGNGDLSEKRMPNLCDANLRQLLES